MLEFLVEAYCPAHDAVGDAPTAESIAEAADQLTREGRRVRLTAAVVVPEDESCLFLFQAVSGEAVRHVADRSGLRFERLVEARTWWTLPVGRDRPSDLALRADHAKSEEAAAEP